MGSRPILPVKVTITIDTMLRLIIPNFGDGLVVGTCERDFTGSEYKFNGVLCKFLFIWPNDTDTDTIIIYERDCPYARTDPTEESPKPGYPSPPLP